HLPRDVIDAKLPSIRDIARTFARIDIYKNPIPVLPAVHYTMGGIPVNIRGEAAPGLYAVGEAACVSVRGRNGLGCNPLLELGVFGKWAGESAGAYAKKFAGHKPLPKSAYEAALARFDALRHASGAQKPSYLRKQMQSRMQRYASIFRNDALLKEG